MVAHFRDLANADPQRVHLADHERVLTRYEFNDRVNRVANLMTGLGLGVGDPVALFASNRADWACASVAASFTGRPPTLVNAGLATAEVEQILASSRSQAIVTDTAHAPVARAAAAALRIASERVLCLDAPSWDTLLASCAPTEPDDRAPYAAAIHYTSGTTGQPKGTRMSVVPHGAPLRDYIERVQGLWHSVGLASDTRYLITGPLYHALPYGALSGVLSLGGQVWLMPRFDPEQSLQMIADNRITDVGAVPAMFIRWLRLPNRVREQFDVSSLRMVGHGGAPCPPDVKRNMIAWMGPVLFEAYGASEFGPVCAITSQEWLAHPGSVGRPIPGVSVRITSEYGADLPPGQTGHIYVRSESGHVVHYLDEPANSAQEVLEDGWFTLGDLGSTDLDGYVYLTDRRTDLIISGGVNVYPAEVEAALLAHEAIDDVAVFGIPDEEWGEQVKAAISLQPSFLPSDDLASEILGWLRSRMAHYKCPRSIDFHFELPRTEDGKLRKRMLRDAYRSMSAAREPRRRTNAGIGTSGPR